MIFASMFKRSTQSNRSLSSISIFSASCVAFFLCCLIFESSAARIRPIRHSVFYVPSYSHDVAKQVEQIKRSFGSQSSNQPLTGSPELNHPIVVDYCKRLKNLIFNCHYGVYLGVAQFSDFSKNKYEDFVYLYNHCRSRILRSKKWLRQIDPSWNYEEIYEDPSQQATALHVTQEEVHMLDLLGVGSVRKKEAVQIAAGWTYCRGVLKGGDAGKLLMSRSLNNFVKFDHELTILLYQLHEVGRFDPVIVARIEETLSQLYYAYQFSLFKWTTWRSRIYAYMALRGCLPLVGKRLNIKSLYKPREILDVLTVTYPTPPLGPPSSEYCESIKAYIYNMNYANHFNFVTEHLADPFITDENLYVTCRYNLVSRTKFKKILAIDSSWRQQGLATFQDSVNGEEVDVDARVNHMVAILPQLMEENLGIGLIANSWTYCAGAILGIRDWLQPAINNFLAAKMSQELMKSLLELARVTVEFHAASTPADLEMCLLPLEAAEQELLIQLLRYPITNSKRKRAAHALQSCLSVARPMIVPKQLVIRARESPTL